MSMRGQFVTLIEDLSEKDPRLITLLGDIGVYSLRNSMVRHPDRIFDIGILEQSSISMAAGLSAAGMIPVFHTIAPFLVERAYEQIKLDFGYQKLGGNFVSVGASFDYASLGCTHQCPADVNILMQIPNLQIIVPGNAQEFEALFRETYDNGMPTYYRLSEMENSIKTSVTFGHANVIKEGKSAIVLAVGPMLENVMEAVEDLDVTVLYYTTVKPFDDQILRTYDNGGPILLCEPYYQGGLCYEIQIALSARPIRIAYIGVPHCFMDQYGTLTENLESAKMTSSDIRFQILDLMKYEEDKL